MIITYKLPKENNVDVNVGRHMSPEREILEIHRKLIIEKRKYEQAISECKKLRTLIKIVVGGKLLSFRK